MFRFFLLFHFLLIIHLSSAQIIDIDYSRGEQNLNQQNGKPEFLRSGFVDLLTNGNIQASARLLKLQIGEPNAFYLPLYIYTGASAKAFGNESLNKKTISDLLNPIGGILNLSFNGLQNIPIFKSGTLTKLRFAYQFGGRIINGTDSIVKKNINFFNGLGNVGLFFQTGAWEGTNTNNMGIFYLQVKGNSSISSTPNLQKIFPEKIDENYFWGYSLDAGIEINEVINVKLSVYQYLNNSKIEELKEPVIKFSLDYSIMKSSQTR